MEKRIFPRLYYHYLTSFSIIDDVSPKEGVCVTENLSLGGVLIEFDEPIPEDTVLEINIATKESILTARARVCHVKQTDVKKFDAGLEFVDISPEDLEQLKILLGED